MEPIPETAEAVAALDVHLDDGHLLEQLRDLGDKVSDIVPDCVGMSLAYLSEGITLTLAASTTEAAILDAMQYLDGGPCVDAVLGERVIEVEKTDALDELAWQLFGEATAAAGIKSTLTLPILVDGEVTGSINLYAASRGAFAGHHQELAAVFGAWAPGAVANSDLSFATRAAAQAVPRLLRERMAVDTALGYLVVSRGLPLEDARRQLEEAAAQAGVTVVELAQTIVELQRGQDGE